MLARGLPVIFYTPILYPMKPRINSITWLLGVLVLAPFQQQTAPPAPTTPPSTELAWQPGEKLRFRVHYGLFTAGFFDMDVAAGTHTKNGHTCYRLNSYGHTVSGFEWFYKVRDKYSTFLDTQSLQPVFYYKDTHQGDYHFSDRVTFDYDAMTVNGVRGEFPLQANTQDMISAFYYARNLDIRSAPAGTVFEIPVFIDDETYPLGLKVLGRDRIKTPLGRFDAIKVTPIVVSGRVFKGEEEMTIWISDDENQVPLQVESPLLVGSAKATLVSYQNPAHPIDALID